MTWHECLTALRATEAGSAADSHDVQLLTSWGLVADGMLTANGKAMMRQLREDTAHQDRLLVALSRAWRGGGGQ